MRELFSDFMLIQHLPNGRERVRLSRKEVLAADVHEGDEVILIEYDNLCARARLQYENGHWYGLIVGKIEDISPRVSAS